jgi:hypothetical protein
MADQEQRSVTERVYKAYTRTLTRYSNWVCSFPIPKMWVARLLLEIWIMTSFWSLKALTFLILLPLYIHRKFYAESQTE